MDVGRLSLCKGSAHANEAGVRFYVTHPYIEDGVSIHPVGFAPVANTHI